MIVAAYVTCLLALSIDTFCVATALGAAGSRSRATGCAVFATCEGAMPAVGMLIGRGLDRLLGTATFWIAIIALVGTGAWMLWERDEDGESAERVAHAMAGPAIWLAGLAVSVDEFAVGLSAGLLRAPLEITIALIAVQAAVASWLGWTLGAHLRRSAGEWGEKAAGTVLIVLALFLAAARFWQLQQ